MFTEDDSKRQDESFAKLKDEFSRLMQQDEAARKALGLNEDGGAALDEADITPDVRKALEEAKAKAEREGAARATQFKNEFFSSSNSKGAPGGHRQGVMRI